MHSTGETTRPVRLTKRTVDAAAPKAAAFFVWCGDLKGFGLKVARNGSKTYIAQ